MVGGKYSEGRKRLDLNYTSVNAQIYWVWMMLSQQFYTREIETKYLSKNENGFFKKKINVCLDNVGGYTV